MSRLVAISSGQIVRIAYNYGDDSSRSDIDAALLSDWNTTYGTTAVITNGSYRAEIGDDWNGTQGVISSQEIADETARQDPVTQTTTGASLTVSLADRKTHHHVILAHNVTSITLSDVPGVGAFEIEFLQDGVGGRTVTGWPSNVVWAEGAEPNLYGAADTSKLTKLYYSGPTQDTYFGHLELKYIFPTSAVFLTEVSNSSTSGAVTVNWALSQKQRLALTENITSVTFSPPPGIGNFILKVVQDTTPRTVTGWPASVKWPGGTAPTISTGSGAIDIIALYFDGTNYFAMASQAFS